MWNKLLSSLGTWFVKQLADHGPRIMRMGIAMAFTLYAVYTALMTSTMTALWQKLPADLQTNWNDAKIYLEYINAWFPLTWFFTLAIAVYTFKGAVWAVKFILKLIPFIG